MNIHITGFGTMIVMPLHHPAAADAGQFRHKLRLWDNSTNKLQSQMTFRLCTLFLKLGLIIKGSLRLLPEGAPLFN